MPVESTLMASVTPDHDDHHAQRGFELLAMEISYISNDCFTSSEFEEEWACGQAGVQAAMDDEGHVSTAPKDLPGHLRRLCESDLLSHEEEVALFRGMNYLKFRAEQLRQQLNPESIDGELVREIDALLEESLSIRDRIITANTRLVISIVRKMVSPLSSFDEMLSDGTLTLMKAVEKFDYDRGFRFSTYAYRSIARNAYRMLANAQKEEARVTRDAEEWAFEESVTRSSSMDDRTWSRLREIAGSIMHRLDRRERFIVRSRYALGSHRRVRTFQFLADKLGVSKERVRQLEQRAVNKLQKMAAEFDVDEPISATA